MKKKIIKIIIVGAGRISAEYLKILKKNSKIKVVGIVSRTQKSSMIKAKKFKISEYGTSLNKMMNELKPDIAIVCVSPSETLKVCNKIFKFKCVSLIEKPLGLSLKETVYLTNLSKKYNHRLYVALNRRFYSSTQKLQKILLNNKDKRIVTVFDQESKSNALKSGHNNKVVKNWMFANSIHLIDYFNIFCRGNFKKISTESFKLDSNQKFLTSKIHYNSGDIGIYHAYWDRPAPWKVTVSCKKSFFTLSPIEKLMEKNYKGKLISYKEEKFDKKFKPGFFAMINSLINAYNNQSSKLPGVKENLKTMKLIHNIYKK